MDSNNLIPAASLWKYLGNGSDQGTAWKNSSFPMLPGRRGPRNSDMARGAKRQWAFGQDAGNEVITTYFRKTFTATNPAQYTSLTLSLTRDDGVVV